MNIENLYKDCQLEALHKHVVDAIRENPHDSSLRSLFVQILCIEGQWERASTQANSLSTLVPETALFSAQARELIATEQLRLQVLTGKAKPEMHSPTPFTEALLQALQTEDKALLEQLQGEIPASPLLIDGQEQEWLIDADSRFSGIFEYFHEGRYGWLPQSALHSIEIAKPTHPIEELWLHVRFSLRSGEQLTARMPGRYPLMGEETAALLMMRETEMNELSATLFQCQGGRCFATPEASIPIQAIKEIRFL